MAERAQEKKSRALRASPRSPGQQESLVRLLDAAVGLLAATREVLGALEHVLESRRDGIVATPGAPLREDDPPAAKRDGSATRIDLTY